MNIDISDGIKWGSNEILKLGSESNPQMIECFIRAAIILSALIFLMHCQLHCIMYCQLVEDDLGTYAIISIFPSKKENRHLKWETTVTVTVTIES